MNYKKRGFYYHFTQDLFKELQKQNLNRATLSWVRKSKKQFWKHNAVLITTINQTYNKGIIFDARRNSGDFHWNYVSKDAHYKCIKNINKSKHFGNLE